jgi:hypothetical protein
MLDNGDVKTTISGTIHDPTDNEYPSTISVSEWASSTSNINDTSELRLKLDHPSVNFNRGGHYRNMPKLLTGPSTMPHPDTGKPTFGLGFMVSGWANTGGGVGHRDLTGGAHVAVPTNPGGSWTITQTTAAYISLNGAVKQNDQSAWTDMLPGTRYDVIGNTFYWYDHPGSIYTTGYERREVFTVSVSNGTERCSLTFHFIQNGTTIHWGEGGFP